METKEAYGSDGACSVEVGQGIADSRAVVLIKQPTLHHSDRATTKISSGEERGEQAPLKPALPVGYGKYLNNKAKFVRPGEILVSTTVSVTTSQGTDAKLGNSWCCNTTTLTSSYNKLSKVRLALRAWLRRRGRNI